MTDPVTAPFTDPVSGARCVLVVVPGGGVVPGVVHPRCDRLADLSLELDAFWCPACRWNGRVSGAWAHDVITAAAGG